MTHDGSLTKIDMALIELRKLTPKELTHPIRTLMKIIHHSYSTTQRALKLFKKESKNESKNESKKNTNSIPKKRTHSIPPEGEGTAPPHIKIDDDLIEKLLLDKINSGDPLSDNFFKTLITFYKDIRGKKDKIRENIDMEEYALVGKSL